MHIISCLWLQVTILAPISHTAYSAITAAYDTEPMFIISLVSSSWTRSDAEFDVFFDLRLNKRLSKQSWGWWFETLWCPLWRHPNVKITNELSHLAKCGNINEIDGWELDCGMSTVNAPLTHNFTLSYRNGVFKSNYHSLVPQPWNYFCLYFVMIRAFIH